jgi:hypothetical protein
MEEGEEECLFPCRGRDQVSGMVEMRGNGRGMRADTSMAGQNVERRSSSELGKEPAYAASPISPSAPRNKTPITLDCPVRRWICII